MGEKIKIVTNLGRDSVDDKFVGDPNLFVGPQIASTKVMEIFDNFDLSSLKKPQTIEEIREMLLAISSRSTNGIGSALYVYIDLIGKLFPIYNNDPFNKNKLKAKEKFGLLIKYKEEIDKLSDQERVEYIRNNLKPICLLISEIEGYFIKETLELEERPEVLNLEA